MTFRANSTIRRLSYVAPLNAIIFFLIFPFWLACICIFMLIHAANCTFYTIAFSEDEIEVTTLMTHKKFKKEELSAYRKDRWGHFGRIYLRFSSGEKYRLYKPENMNEFDLHISAFFAPPNIL